MAAPEAPGRIVKLAELRDRVGYQAGLLGAVALAASAALGLANQQTREPIAAAQARDLQESLRQVLPPERFDNDLVRDSVEVKGERGGTLVYRAFLGGAFSAAVFRASGRGYAGPIDLVMAVDRDGTVLGVRVTRHTETPGLGDMIEAAKDDWIRDFEGKSLEHPAPARWQVKKDGGDFDQFAGATITPRAVVKAVREGLEFYAAHRAEIAGASPAPATAAAQEKAP
jgi:electron transport complex protein RnfG